MNDKQTEIKPMSEAEIRGKIALQQFLLTHIPLTKLKRHEYEACITALCKVLGYSGFEHYAMHNETHVNAFVQLDATALTE